MGRFDAVIFDMDGTLVDTLAMTVGAVKKYAPQCGLIPVTREALLKAIGLCNHDFYLALYPEASDEQREKIEGLVEEGELEIGRTLGEGILFPGVMQMLHRLRDGGVRLMLASTGTERHVQGSLSIAGILSIFEKIGCGAADKTEMTAKLLSGLDPARVVFVGDGAKDIQAARNNGLLIYGAGFGYADDDAFDAVFDSPEELTKALLGDSAG